VLALLNGLKKAEFQSMTIRDSGDRQLAETLVLTRVRELIRANMQLTVHGISAKVCIFYGTCQAILTEYLNMRRMSAKFVPRVLTIE
jgi:hypothetical protein